MRTIAMQCVSRGVTSSQHQLCITRVTCNRVFILQIDHKTLGGGGGVNDYK